MMWAASETHVVIHYLIGACTGHGALPQHNLCRLQFFNLFSFRNNIITISRRHRNRPKLLFLNLNLFLPPTTTDLIVKFILIACARFLFCILLRLCDYMPLDILAIIIEGGVMIVFSIIELDTEVGFWGGLLMMMLDIRLIHCSICLLNHTI